MKVTSKRSKDDFTLKVRIDPRDVWCLDYTLAQIISPGLKELRRIGHGHPVTYLITTMDDWYEILDKMIWSFDMVIDDENQLLALSPQEYMDLQERIDEGLILFGRYFRALWD